MVICRDRRTRQRWRGAGPAEGERCSLLSMDLRAYLATSNIIDAIVMQSLSALQLTTAISLSIYIYIYIYAGSAVGSQRYTASLQFTIIAPLAAVCPKE
jgi:hypothetical protein